MIARILSFSVHQRWLVVLLTVAAAAFGGWSMTKLPIADSHAPGNNTPETRLPG